MSLDGHEPLSGRRVLIVEDEYFLAHDIERSLQSLGAEVAGPVGYLQDGLAIVGHGAASLAAEARLLAAPVTLEQPAVVRFSCSSG